MNSGNSALQKQIIPLLGTPYVLGLKINQGKSLIWLFLKVNVSTAISVKKPCRELSTDITIKTPVFGNAMFWV